MNKVHSSLADGRWQTFSLMEQLGNIGSEVSRALQWRGRDETLYQNAVYRAFELFDLTIDDARWHTRLKEIVRAREMFADAVSSGRTHQSTLEDLDHYFLQFAIAARIIR